MPKNPFIPIDRRQFLKVGAGAVTAASLGTNGLFPRRAFAQSASLTLGEAEVTVFSDGTLTLPMNFVLPEQSEDEIKALFEPHGLATDQLTPDCNVTLYQSGDRLALFDVGSGPNFQPTAGDLIAGLEDAGIDPADITDVIFTHAHPDHLWGVLDDFDDPLFYEAQYWVPDAEWAFWMAEDAVDQMDDARKSFAVGAQNRFAVIEDQVTMVKPGQEVLPGVEAVDTSGHTPGHMSYMLHGGGESVLVLGDAITNAVISFERPEWQSGSDQDRDKGAATRTALLDRLAAEKTRIIGYHLPHPGHGVAERSGSAYRFVPTG